MHPILFNIGPLPIHSYGALIATGFLASVWLIKRLSIRAGLNTDRVLDLVFWAFLVGFAGARLTYVVTMWSQFENDLLGVFKVWEGGLVFYGGPLAVVPFAIWYIRRHRLPVWKVMDVLAPGLVTGHIFGRIGCLGAGCCYGRPTDVPWAIKLNSELVETSLRNVPLHPTQIYESGSLAILLAGLLWINKHKRFDGQVVLSYFMAYAVIRSVIEVYRGDSDRGYLIGDLISTSQGISIVAFIIAAVFLVRRLGAAR